MLKQSWRDTAGGERGENDASRAAGPLRILRPREHSEQRAVRSLVILTYPREPHSFAFYTTPARTPRPAVAENAFEDVNALVRRHLPTKPSPIDPSLIKQVPFEAK